MIYGLELIEQAKVNLRKTLEEGASLTLPDPGWRWGAYSEKLRRDIENLKTPVEAIHRAQSPSDSGFETRMTGNMLLQYTLQMEENCRTIFPDFADHLTSFAESPLSQPDTLCVVNGRLVSSALYNLIIHTMRCVSCSKPACVMEIGGGYGAPGRVWLTNNLHRPDTYIDVDLPESLFYAEIFLRANFPDIQVTYIHSPNDLNNMQNTANNSTPHIILCPASRIDLLSDYPIDLLVNTGSMQEMTDNFVVYYNEWLDACRCPLFYSANYFAQRIDSLLEGMNYCAPCSGDSWETVFRQLHGELPRPVAEMIFRRKESTQKLQVEAATILDVNHKIANASDFLVTFDQIRNLTDPSSVLEFIEKTIREMPYIPKELLFLARRAQDLCNRQTEPAALISAIEQRLKLLEDLARSGLRRMGMVDDGVAEIRDQMVRASGLIQPFAGSAKCDGTNLTVVVNDKPLKVINGDVGVIERFAVNQYPPVISGWAFDRAAKKAPIKVLLFSNDELIDVAIPEIERPEFDLGGLFIGFEFRVPRTLAGQSSSELLVFAEFDDGTVVRLPFANAG
jgi:hypothetical protein